MKKPATDENELAHLPPSVTPFSKRYVDMAEYSTMGSSAQTIETCRPPLLEIRLPTSIICERMSEDDGRSLPVKDCPKVKHRIGRKHFVVETNVLEHSPSTPSNETSSKPESRCWRSFQNTRPPRHSRNTFVLSSTEEYERMVAVNNHCYEQPRNDATSPKDSETPISG